MRRALFFIAAALAFGGCSKKDESAPPPPPYVFAPIDIQRSFIAMTENPDADDVLLIGEAAKKCAPYFDAAGVKSSVTANGKFDLVVMACKSVSIESCAKVRSLLRKGGAIAWMIDVTSTDAASFRKMIESFDMPAVRLWMVGEKQWLLTSSTDGAKKRLDDMFNLFSVEGAFGALAEARSPAVHHLFAAYAGAREDIMPAFEEGDQKAEVRPEFFLTKEIPSLDWIDASRVDADIAKKFFDEARSMQVIRRLAVEGSMLAEAGREKEAVDAWARALKRNPNDMFVLERLDRLERNAKGFFEVRKILMAMKCYETMVLINPENQAALNNFGVCLKKIGRSDIAERAFRRVKELQELQARERR